MVLIHYVVLDNQSVTISEGFQCSKTKNVLSLELSRSTFPKVKQT